MPPADTLAAAAALRPVNEANTQKPNVPENGAQLAPAEEAIPENVGGDVKVPVMAAADSATADKFFAPPAPPPAPPQTFADTPPAPPYPQPTYNGTPMVPVNANKTETPATQAQPQLVEVPQPQAPATNFDAMTDAIRDQGVKDMAELAPDKLDAEANTPEGKAAIEAMGVLGEHPAAALAAATEIARNPDPAERARGLKAIAPALRRVLDSIDPR